MKNKVQLITYVDRLSGGGFKELRALLDGPLAGVFGGVHLLPFFDPIDGADAGFDPVDHTRVDARLGDWDDVRAIGQRLEVVADVIVNHMSSDSPQFQDYSRHGDASAWNGLFLTFDRVFPDGADAADLQRVYRPRPGLPFRDMTLTNGERRRLWSTFTPKQIDIDVTHPAGRAYLGGILDKLAASGVRMVRLDAVGYAIKKAGTDCFMLPETFDFIEDFADRARALGMEVLVEVHSHYARQIEIAERVDWVYDFALPPLLLHAFTFETAAALRHWIEIRPNNALTVLDTHDGIGIVDAGPAGELPGLIDEAEMAAIFERAAVATGGHSTIASVIPAWMSLPHQINATFFSALGADANRYLLARAVQLWLPGRPQLYYVGLLGGLDDVALFQRTGQGRDVNRHVYTPDEVEAALATEVTRAQLALVRLRSRHPAFGGEFGYRVEADGTLELEWVLGDERATLQVRFGPEPGFRIRTTGAGGPLTADSVAALAAR